MKNLNRKEFLKLGTALPISLSPLGLTAASNKQETPKRIIFINNSLGFYGPYFFPKKQGDLTSSNYLKNFRVKNKLTVFQNLFHPGMETSNHDSEKSFLTGTPNPESSNFVNGISLDQILAKKMGEHTRFPFLNFNIYDRGWGCSWNGQGSAIPVGTQEISSRKKIGCCKAHLFAQKFDAVLVVIVISAGDAIFAKFHKK